jgi:type IV pilus assembly protein PilA
MRQAFTLIELMIVIAIIAIIAAIAIPNLLESRISSNEAAAASSLKAGVFPGQVQFQAGGYVDKGGGSSAVTPNGIGDFAKNYGAMSGSTTTAAATGITATDCPVVPLSLLPATWNTLQPTVNNYLFNVGSNVEIGFCATCYPSDQGSSIGRRCFAINAAGTVYATAAATTNGSGLVASAANKADVPFGAGFSVAAAGWSVYKR